ncbi:hypothetical protein [Sneathiella sp.]|uniref:hypothetical protein n=1 Tax=Sneathiella sp. TaxID=1964365 RepID=UPI0035635936
MTASMYGFLKTTVGAATLLAAGLALASCVAHEPPPEQVASSKPTVTYKYHNDEELIGVNQRAVTFCTQYNLAPRPTNFTNDSDGAKVVSYECVPSAVSATDPVMNPNLIYTYRTDQELLNASRSAQAYCMNIGSQEGIANIVTNADGSKTVTFQCHK